MGRSIIRNLLEDEMFQPCGFTETPKHIDDNSKSILRSWFKSLVMKDTHHKFCDVRVGQLNLQQNYIFKEESIFQGELLNNSLLQIICLILLCYDLSTVLFITYDFIPLLK